MIEKTIGEIEAKIRGADAVSEERKRELLQLLGTLKSEVGNAGENPRRTGRKHRRLCPAFRPRSHARPIKIRNHSNIRFRDCARRWTASRNPIPNSSRSSTPSATRCRIWGFRTRLRPRSRPRPRFFAFRLRERRRGREFSILARLQRRNRRHDFVGDLLVNFLEPRLGTGFRLGAQFFKIHRPAIFHRHRSAAAGIVMCRP